MSELKIITNNQPRDVLYGFQLPAKYRKESDYLSDNGYADQGFFIYKGQAYSIGEFMHTNSFPNWHGSLGDSYFSGLLVRIIDGGEAVIVGRYYF